MNPIGLKSNVFKVSESFQINFQIYIYKFRYTGESGVSRIEDGYLKNPDSEKPIQVVKGSYSYIGPDEKVR